MKIKIVLIVMSLGMLLFATCRHEPNEIPVPSNPNGNNHGNGNVKDSVCFAEEILPLLISNCAKSGCHDAITHKEGINLTSYSNVMSTISGNDLLQALYATGSDAMPPLNSPPALTTAQKNLIQLWIYQGMKDGIDCDCTIDTNNVTFSGTVFPIFQANCLGCHTSTAPILTNYSLIKFQLDTGRIYNAINHLGGVSPMPKNSPQLSLCRLTAFNKWVNAGAPNN